MSRRAGHEPVEQQHDARGDEQRHALAERLLDEAAVETEPLERALDPPEDHRLREVQEDDDEDERRCPDDEDDVDELAANGRAAALDPHRDLEARTE